MQFVITSGACGCRSSTEPCARFLRLLIGRCLLVLALACLSFSPLSGADDLIDGAVLPASCLVPDAGAPSCGIESSPGSSQFEPEVPFQVGNPINVVSGNKYQYELDYQSPASGLALARHYNSSLSQYDIGLGAGWRHSYQVVLTRISDDRLDVVQSDGRLISFHRASLEQPDLFVASLASDGYLELGDRSIWYLGDGRRLIFQGSYLVRLELGERAGVLSLRYQDGKLKTVTDRHGDSLSFNYVPGNPSLPEFGSGQIVQPAGSLASVVLPGGLVLQYNYGPQGNLLGVQYPEGTSTGYVYGNTDWPAHLTRRQSTADDRLSEWRYDEQGLGIAWVEGGGVNGLEIERGRPAGYPAEEASVGSADADAVQAVVTYADGRKTQYRWAPTDRQDNDGRTVVDIQCDNCLPAASAMSFSNIPRDISSDGSTRQADTGLSSLGGSEWSDPSPRPGLSSMDASVGSMLQGLVLTDVQPVQGSGLVNYSGQYPHSLGSVPIQLTTDRLGKVKDLRIGERGLDDMLEAAYGKPLPPCFAGNYPENPDTFSHNRIAALGGGELPCDLDAGVIVELMHSVESSLGTEAENGRLASPGDVESKEAVPFWDPMRRYCSLPAGMTCEQLADDLDMAELSRCAYGGVSCEPTFRLVSPSEIGMSDDRFDNQGFDAQLYQDPDNPERYILVFRGTDEVGDDWVANLDQARALWTRQYDLALNLGQDVVDVMPDSDIEFAGHSLGGGLASIAALATERSATVFNTAALQPGTAGLYGLRPAYRNAEAYIRHLHTDYDPVTVLQDRADELDIYDLQTAPGQTTQIPNPDIPWVNSVHANADGFVDGFFPVIWHSMDAVVHVLESLINHNCLP